MLQDAGETVSPYLMQRQSKPRRSGPRKTVKRKKHRTAQAEGQYDESGQFALNGTPEGMFDQPIPIASDNRYYIRVPKNITTDQFKLVKVAVGVIEEMANQNKGSK